MADCDPSDRCDCTYPDHPTADGRCANPSIRSEDPDLTDFPECGCCVADCPDAHPEPRGIGVVPGSRRIAAEYVATLPIEKQVELREAEARGELRIVPQAEMRLRTLQMIHIICDCPESHAGNGGRCDNPVGPGTETRCAACAADVDVDDGADRHTRLSRAVEAGHYQVSGPAEYGPEHRSEPDPQRMALIRAEVAAVERAEMETGTAPVVRETVQTSPNFADSVVLTAGLSARVHDAVAAAAADHGTDTAAVIRSALATYLDDPDAVPTEPAARVVVVADPELRETLARIAAEAEAAELVPDDGRPIDPATVSMPNFATSVTVAVRVSGGTAARVAAVAAEHEVKPRDVVFAAVCRWLQAQGRWPV